MVRDERFRRSHNRIQSVTCQISTHLPFTTAADTAATSLFGHVARWHSRASEGRRGARVQGSVCGMGCGVGEI